MEINKKDSIFQTTTNLPYISHNSKHYTNNNDNEEGGTIVLSSVEETIKKEPGFFELKCNVDTIVIVSDSD